MNKKRKISNSTASNTSTSTPTLSPVKVEVKEENIFGNDYLQAKGRFQGVLKQLTEQSDSDSDNSSDDSLKGSSGHGKRGKRKNDSHPAAFHHTYVMKLFDRSVDLARFEEDTPLYPICRAWMANQPRNPQPVIKRRVSTPDLDSVWSNSTYSDIHHLPPPEGPPITRIPSPTPEQKEEVDKETVAINYEDTPPVPREQLIKNHLRRWVAIKKKWKEQSMKNEERYAASKHVLQTIYSKAQEGLETD